MKIFLGGTCNKSTWRGDIIPSLEKNDIYYFNPIVERWNEELQLEEIRLQRKEICDYNLYVITPLMEGVFSIAEMVDDSNKKPDKTIICILSKEDGGKLFTNKQIKSLIAVSELCVNNGAKACHNLDDVIEYLKTKNESKNNN